MLTVCAHCGTPHEKDTRCPCQGPQRRDHALDDHRRGSAASRGYDARWRRLSELARRRQPFCTDCGSTSNLQADHSPDAWRRRDLGLPIRLDDIDVVCAPCNIARGAARGPDAIERPTIGSARAALDPGGKGRPDPALDPLRQGKMSNRV